MEDRRISGKSIAEQLGISRERGGSIIHEVMEVLVACFLPGRAKDLSALLCYSVPRYRRKCNFIYAPKKWTYYFVPIFTKKSCNIEFKLIWANMGGTDRNLFTPLSKV